MKRIVWTFGLIAGAVLSITMVMTIAVMDVMATENAEVIGYTTMVAAFLMVYFGVRSYRDTALDGAIGFGRAFKVGMLIVAVASVCYVATWEVIYYRVMPDFAEKYSARVLEKAKSAGATAEQLEAKRVEMEKFGQLYKNPAFNIGMTFLEPLPVGLLIALVSAGVLSRKRKPAGFTQPAAL